MTLTQLKYIIAVNKTRHFAKAADLCFVTQPTLSMQIQKLEQELDVIIFDRTKSPIIPTDIGISILEQAKIALQETNKISEIIKGSKNIIEGEFKLGIIPTVSPYLLPLFLKQFSEKFIGVRLIIEELTTEEILRRLSNDTLDSGILATPLNDNSITADVLYYEPFFLYTSDAHELYLKKIVTVNDLNGQDIWLMSEGHCFRDQVAQICKKVREPSLAIDKAVRFESGNFQTLIKLVDQNFGITLLPNLALSELDSEEQKKRIRYFDSPVPIREISIVYNRTFIKQAIKKALRDEIIANIPQSLLTQDGEIISP